MGALRLITLLLLIWSAQAEVFRVEMNRRYWTEPFTSIILMDGQAMRVSWDLTTADSWILNEACYNTATNGFIGHLGFHRFMTSSAVKPYPNLTAKLTTINGIEVAGSIVQGPITIKPLDYQPRAFNVVGQGMLLATKIRGTLPPLVHGVVGLGAPSGTFEDICPLLMNLKRQKQLVAVEVYIPHGDTLYLDFVLPQIKSKIRVHRPYSVPFYSAPHGGWAFVIDRMLLLPDTNRSRWLEVPHVAILDINVPFIMLSKELFLVIISILKSIYPSLQDISESELGDGIAALDLTPLIDGDKRGTQLESLLEFPIELHCKGATGPLKIGRFHTLPCIGSTFYFPFAYFTDRDESLNGLPVVRLGQVFFQAKIGLDLNEGVIYQTSHCIAQ